MPRVEALVLGPDPRLHHPSNSARIVLERVLEDRREHEVLAPRGVLRVFIEPMFSAPISGRSSLRYRVAWPPARPARPSSS